MCSFACGAMILLFIMVVALIAVKHHAQQLDEKWERLLLVDADKSGRDNDNDAWRKQRAALFSDLRADAAYAAWRYQLFALCGTAAFLMLLSQVALNCRLRAKNK